MKSKKKAKSFTSEPDAWLLFAQEDLKAAKILLREGPWNTVCFHSQQGSEKALKAYIRTHTSGVPRVHSLGKLIELCSKINRSFLKLKSVAASLDRYYIPTRYPEAAAGSLPEGLPDKNDAKQSIVDMGKIFKHVRKQLRKPNQGPLL